MELLFDEKDICYYASKYDIDYDKPIEVIVTEIKEKRYLTQSDLIKLSKWIKNRRTDLVYKNSNERIIRVTREALTSTNEPDRINVSQCLDGVSLGISSSILHWFHEDDYPIWSKLARSAIKPIPSESQWQNYVSFCRNTARQNKVDMRTLDRALCVHTVKETQTNEFLVS